MLAGSVPLAAVGFTAKPKEAARRQILVPLGCVLVLFLVLFLPADPAGAALHPLHRRLPQRGENRGRLPTEPSALSVAVLA